MGSFSTSCDVFTVRAGIKKIKKTKKKRPWVFSRLTGFKQSCSHTALVLSSPAACAAGNLLAPCGFIACTTSRFADSTQATSTFGLSAASPGSRQPFALSTACQNDQGNRLITSSLFFFFCRAPQRHQLPKVRTPNPEELQCTPKAN